MNRLLISAFAIILTAVAVGTAFASAPLPVSVSILPQQYMVERIGKDRVDVQVMVRPGASPATYEPKPAQMAALSKTRLYFSIGVPFENFWLDKITASNPKMKLVHTDKGIPKIPIAAHEHDRHEHHKDHAHQNEADHGHTGMDPHIWTSPALVRIQAHTICQALAEEDPANRAFYRENYDAFIREIDGLEKELHNLFKDKTGTRFMVFHPSWGYFARDFGLDMIPIEMEGKDPKPAQLMELIRHARDAGIRVLFVQPQFSAKSARLIAREINGRVVAADPLAQDWMENMKTIASQFKEALK
ncbi:MAG: zinc ABC transporter substrate-binding protein [Desulfobacter sp.]|nr:MAG: zinc ABC transporter substrate-binding protein [Desulfobacter sp.]